MSVQRSVKFRCLLARSPWPLTKPYWIRFDLRGFFFQSVYKGLWKLPIIIFTNKTSNQFWSAISSILSAYYTEVKHKVYTKTRFKTVPLSYLHIRWRSQFWGFYGLLFVHGPLKRWYPTTTLHGVTTQHWHLKRWCPTITLHGVTTQKTSTWGKDI
jgi:hypothetical protein